MDVLIEKIKMELADRQRRNPHYSLRAFARDLDVSPTSLSLVLASKRRPSRQMRESVVERLSLSPARYLEQKTDSRAKEELIADDEFLLIADWYHLAILNLLRPGIGPLNLAKLTQRLALTRPIAQAAVDRLLRLGFIRQEKGGYVRVTRPLRTSEDIPSHAIRRFHQDTLAKAGDALTNLPMTEREFSTVFLMIRPNKIDQARELIRRFRSEFIEIFDPDSEAAEGSELFALGLQLFPLTYKPRRNA